MLEWGSDSDSTMECMFSDQSLIWLGKELGMLYKAEFCQVSSFG